MPGNLRAKPKQCGKSRPSIVVKGALQPRARSGMLLAILMVEEPALCRFETRQADVAHQRNPRLGRRPRRAHVARGGFVAATRAAHREQPRPDPARADRVERYTAARPPAGRLPGAPDRHQGEATADARAPPR